jgi:hypothetical protein
MRRCIALAFVVVAACDGGAMPLDASTDGAAFVAESADFEGFQSWERIPLPHPTVPIEAHAGSAFVYVSQRAPAGATRYPRGTMMVKTIESGTDPRGWTVHAIARRGEPFNPIGAVGWEFFGLQLHEDGRPVILWRSDGSGDGHDYGGVLPGESTEATCNDCHSVAWQDDSVLTPELSLHD